MINRLWLSTVLEAGKSVVKALADLVSGESLLPGSQMGPAALERMGVFLGSL